MPKIWAVVLNLNGREEVCECLQSLEGSSLHVGAVVVDNGSSDGSQEEIKRRFPKAELIENKRNLGCAAARNIGTRRALEMGAEHILHLDNDVVLERNAVKDLVRALEGTGAHIAAPKIFWRDSKKLWYAGGAIDWRRGREVHYGFGEEDSRAYDEMKEVSYAPTCTLLVRREVFEHILFDEGFHPIRGFDFTYFDLDFCEKARRKGFRLIYVPSAVARHRVSATVRQRFRFPLLHATVSRLVFVSKHLKKIEAVAFFKYLLLLPINLRRGSSAKLQQQGS